MLLHFCNDKKEINYNKYMVYTNILLILVTVLCVILLANRTKILKRKSEKYITSLPYKPLDINKVKKLYSNGELLCSVGYLHYQLDFANAIQKEDLGIFLGYAMNASEPISRIYIYDNQNVQRGYIDSQTELYHTLSVRKKVPVYGVSLHNAKDGYSGEVCIRIK